MIASRLSAEYSEGYLASDPGRSRDRFVVLVFFRPFVRPDICVFTLHFFVFRCHVALRTNWNNQ